MSLGDGDKRVPIKILRDTGSVDSFIWESVFPFSSVSDTGDSILIQGMGMFVFSAPVHKLPLISDLVNGEVDVGVCPQLPVDGVDMILGNSLAGWHVWADDPPPNVITQKSPPIEPVSCPDDVAMYSACVVARAKSASVGTFDSVQEKVAECEQLDMSLPEQFQSISHDE